MHDTLWRPLAVEVGHLLRQLIVLHQHGAARASRLRILVICYGRASRSGHDRAFVQDGSNTNVRTTLAVH
jgi:hypothetical protein